MNTTLRDVEIDVSTANDIMNELSVKRMGFNPEDRLQKTWIPEGTAEYKEFKHVTHENAYLADFLNVRFKLGGQDLVLDVGGRDGDIGSAVQKPESLHLVDPDPTLDLRISPAKFIRKKIQDVALKDRYTLIICSHVLGYLGLQSVQKRVFETLVRALRPGGTLVLFYNTNSNYMGELLKFSQALELDGHYDYFDEHLFASCSTAEFEVKFSNVTFNLDYPTFDALARCCWFLFGAMDQDIEKVAALFLPKLTKDLKAPSFPIDERIALITRRQNS